MGISGTAEASCVHWHLPTILKFCALACPFLGYINFYPHFKASRNCFPPPTFLKACLVFYPVPHLKCRLPFSVLLMSQIQSASVWNNALSTKPSLSCGRDGCLSRGSWLGDRSSLQDHTIETCKTAQQARGAGWSPQASNPRAGDFHPKSFNSSFLLLVCF